MKFRCNKIKIKKEFSLFGWPFSVIIWAGKLLFIKGQKYFILLSIIVKPLRQKENKRFCYQCLLTQHSYTHEILLKLCILSSDPILDKKNAFVFARRCLNYSLEVNVRSWEDREECKRSYVGCKEEGLLDHLNRLLEALDERAA